MPPITTVLTSHHLTGRRLMGYLTLAGLIVGLIVAGLEYIGGLIPCALCWTQRGVLALFTLTAFIGWALWPTGRLGRGLLATSLGLICLGGIAAALRHLYVMANPESLSCGGGIKMVIEFLPWQDVLKTLILGGSSCADVSSVWGIPIPAWSLIAFIMLLVLSLRALKRH